jgi:hypothetical protein
MNDTLDTNDFCKGRKTPGEIRKEAKRFKDSRDVLKEKNHEKALRLKAQHGKMADLTLSRNKWRKRTEDLQETVVQLQQALAEEQKLRFEREILIQKHEQLLGEKAQEQLQQQLMYEKRVEELKKKPMR